MKTPFTIEQFFGVFREYNETLLPAQVALLLLSLVALSLAFRPVKRSNHLILLILAVFWLWMGIAYHLVFFASINPAANIFGGLFIIQGLMFLFYGVLRTRLTFKFRPNVYGIAGIVLIAYAWVIYPALGYMAGHVYPASPTFGLPCPTTIFTFGMLLFLDKKCPVPLLIIPLLWSILGISAALSFGVIEDMGLIVSGLFSFLAILIKNRSFRIQQSKTLPNIQPSTS